MEPWQSIDSAPRDGSRILLYREHAQFGVSVIIGYWKKGNSRPYWSHDAEDELGVMEARKFQPSFWMPLPAFPVSPTPDEERTIVGLSRVGHLKRFKRR